jgi:hypothetical protein
LGSERESKEKVGGGVVIYTTVLEGGKPKKICGVEGSQAVPASPSGRGEACMRDFFNVNFKEVGATAMGHRSGSYFTTDSQSDLRPDITSCPNVAV